MTTESKIRDMIFEMLLKRGFAVSDQVGGLIVSEDEYGDSMSVIVRVDELDSEVNNDK